MMRTECEFESEVLATVLQDRWPDHAGDELRSHVAACAICSDVAAIAGAIDASREYTRACAAIPDSGRVWWLAQRRARREAAEAANRPLNAAQAIAAVCGAAVVWATLPVREWFQTVIDRLTGVEFGALLGAAARVLAEHGLAAAAVLLLLLFVPAAACLAMGRD